MWPIADAGDQAVLDRIDVAVLDVAAEILFVADQVFPEPTLPDAAFAARNANRAAQFSLGNNLGEVDLDQPPAQREIGVAGRQCPNRVDMIGQHHHGVNRERVARLREPRRLAQHLDMVCQQAPTPVEQIYSEEPASTGHERAAIIRHGGDNNNGTAQCARLGAMRCAYCALPAQVVLFHINWTGRCKPEHPPYNPRLLFGYRGLWRANRSRSSWEASRTGRP